MSNQFLLIEDVENVGRSGDVVSLKPGYARNFLLPKKKAVIADKSTLKMQTRLKEERMKRAERDKKDAEELAKKLAEMELLIKVKSDVEGKLYGSVSSADIVQVLGREGIVINKKFVLLSTPIKKVGSYKISLKLNEGVPAAFTLKVEPEEGIVLKAEEEKEEKEEEKEKETEAQEEAKPKEKPSKKE